MKTQVNTYKTWAWQYMSVIQNWEQISGTYWPVRLAKRACSKVNKENYLQKKRRVIGSHLDVSLLPLHRNTKWRKHTYACRCVHIDKHALTYKNTCMHIHNHMHTCIQTKKWEMNRKVYFMWKGNQRWYQYN